MKKIPGFILSIILMFLGQTLCAQNKLVTYRNPRNSYDNKDTSNTITNSTLKGLVFLESKVNEITLNGDSTFDFWSRPNVSCFTWQEHKGTWKKSKDTILFYDNYEVVENDVKVIYQKNNEHTYHINFLTDKNSGLKNKELKVQYIYDYSFCVPNQEI